MAWTALLIVSLTTCVRSMNTSITSITTASNLTASTNDPPLTSTKQTDTTGVTATTPATNGSVDIVTTSTSTSQFTGNETMLTSDYQPTTGISTGTPSKRAEERDIFMTILVPTAAAGGGFILILTVIVLIVICKRKTKAISIGENNDSKSGIRVNTLYISADEVADIKQQDGHTNNGFLTDHDSKYDTLQSSENHNEIELSNIEQPQAELYAVVNKKSKSDSVKEETPISASCNNPQNISDHDSLQRSENQNEIEFQNTEQTQGALYAVVNKKNGSGSAKGKTLTSFKNQDELNNEQVEVNTDSSQSSNAPSVRIASNETEGEKVTYSEVTIGD